MSIWATWTRGEELSHRSASASKSSRASLGRLSDSARIWPRIKRQRDVVGIFVEELLEQSIGLLGLAVLVMDGRVEPGKLRGTGVPCTRLAKQLAGLVCLAQLFVNQDGEILRARPPLPAGPQPIDLRQSLVMMSKLHLDLGLAQRDRRAPALFQGRGFLEFLGRACRSPDPCRAW